ncbi:TPA: hypothetical protein ACIR09_003605 [Pseudomonas aeruginosa]
MTKANECTCPSGDGSLVHPCPAHPAPVEQAEVERPEVVAWRYGFSGGIVSDKACLDEWKSGGEYQSLMTVAQHERIVKAWIERWKAYIELSAKTAAQRDAALARVAELEHVLRVVVNAADHGSWPTTVMHGIEKVREVLAGSAPPVKDQPEETPGEILAAKLIETWAAKHGKPAPWSKIVEITALATNMPNDERDRLLALDDDVDAQAQHSVPEEFSFEYRHPNGECHTVTVSREQVINEMPDFLFEALCSKFCNCEPVGETNVVECCCDEYAEEFKLIAAAPGKEG